MKKLSLLALFFAVVVAISSCKKTEEETPGNNPGANEITVPEANLGLYIKHTGSKCPPCGGWGWTANEELLAYSEGKAAGMSAYSQNFVAQLFITQVATDLDKAWGVSGWPTFSANGVTQLDRPGGSVNVTSEKNKVKAAIDAHKAAPVVANTGFKTTVDGNVMTIETRTKFFQAGSGDYNLAVYVLEDGVVGAQSGHPSTPNVAHHHVLRGSATMEGKPSGTTWGETVFTGSVAAGASLNKKFIFDITGFNKEKLEVIAVIWKKEGTLYKFVNANTNQK